MISRRLTILGGAALGGSLAGCRFYSDMPPVVLGGSSVDPNRSIMKALRASDDHSLLAAALEKTGLVTELETLGPLTLFAPNNLAFSQLQPESAKAQLDSDEGFLRAVLLGHIIAARLTTEDLWYSFPQLGGKTKVFSLSRQIIEIRGDPKKPTVVDMRKRTINVLDVDAIASNGIIHNVDGFLLPKADALASP